MPKKKDISQLVPDLKRGLSNSTYIAAQKISESLRDWGPYWTGQFYNALGGADRAERYPRQPEDQSFINANGALEYQGKEYREPGDKPASELLPLCRSRMV